jgi:hypothetical protein
MESSFKAYSTAGSPSFISQFTARDFVGTECTLVYCSLYTRCIYRVLTPRELKNQVVNLQNIATDFFSRSIRLRIGILRYQIIQTLLLSRPFWAQQDILDIRIPTIGYTDFLVYMPFGKSQLKGGLHATTGKNSYGTG